MSESPHTMPVMKGFMEPQKLARVRWQVGQPLLPEHFQAQEGALTAELRRYAEFAGLPVVGVGALELNRILLAEGTLSLTSLSAVLPGGYLVELPGNATVAPFSLEETGRSQLTVYLHLLRETRDAEGLPLYEEDPPALQRAVYLLQLSADPAVEGGHSSLALAGLSKDEQGRWRLSREQLPPLLRVGPHPFLEELFAQLDELLQQDHGQLRTSIRDSDVRGDRLSNARRALCAVRQLQALRQDMRHGIYPPTYNLFEALRGLYFETCCYLEAEPEEELPPYRHEEPGPGLLRWMELLNRSFRPQTSQRSYRAFECRDGRFVLAPCPRTSRPPMTSTCWCGARSATSLGGWRASGWPARCGCPWCDGRPSRAFRTATSPTPPSLIHSMRTSTGTSSPPRATSGRPCCARTACPSP